MRIDVFNIDEFIKKNSCPQVTNPLYFDFSKTPTADGLFSYDLFGISDNDRKNIFGYIDLRGRYIHPLIYSMMLGRMGSLRDIISGEKFAAVVNGKITVVPEDYPGAGNGLDFIYKNYDSINWLDEVEEEETDSIDKKTRLKFLRSLKKEEFFVTKWLVIPPFYRAVSSENQSMGDNINKLYKALISRTNAMKTGFGLDFFGNQTRFRIQSLLLEIFEETTRPIKGKGSMLRKHLLGKTIDFTASNVITSPEISKANKPEEMPVQFGYGSFPLPTLMSLFHPFFVNLTTQFLEKVLAQFQDSFRADIKSVNLNQFNTEFAEKLIKLFIKSEEERFKPLEFEYTDLKGQKVRKKMAITQYNSEADARADRGFKRAFTYTDLFFMIAKDVVADKHIYVTRYPVISFQNIYPSKIKIQTTSKTLKECVIRFGGQLLRFRDYPLVKFEGDSVKHPETHHGWLNVFVPGNVYLKALDGDYDGDMLYMRGVFTKEANAEADKLIYAKSNLLGASGRPARGISLIGKEALVSLYELTKDGK